ncbi:SRPBCC family protein [Pararoseomonas indoligenes]|uniref:SRPBCC domain-containing protein n=1 Tax=Roseomonas indoligenes TaxID=2820811 RepID=A0A940MXD9_9PROT|nr:SRPBCC family protein [Pararoseomonas indoligenes]MBP0492932.1 SRPBCC domain-containing protein [Pararoseomonas indoligenes]
MAVDPTTEGLFVRRRFEAPPERVFQGWTNPELAVQWLFSGLVGEGAELAMDARPGGVFRLRGARHEGYGEFIELDPPRRVVLAFGIPALRHGVDRFVVEIAPNAAGSLLSLTKEGLPPDLTDETEGDWGVMLDRLAAIL